MADVLVGVSSGSVIDTAEQVNLVKNTLTTTPAGVSVATTDTKAVLTPAAGRPFKGRYMVVRLVENGTAVTTTVTFKAGVTGQTPANQAAYGDLAVTLADADDKLIQLELSRFLQADGTVNAVVSGTNGAVKFSIINLSKGAA
jgi:hypothetical protein